MTTPTPTAWAHLPNAALIDRILADLRARPQAWTAACDAAYDAARDAAWGAAWDAARGAAYDAARDDAWYAARTAARDAARGATLTLIAWDDCAYVLDMPADAVRLLAANGHHPAVLLLPAAVALNHN